MTSLKPNINKRDIDELQKVPSGFSNLISKVQKLDIGKLETIPIDLSRLSDIIKNELLEILNMMSYLKKLKQTDYDVKIIEIKGKIPLITG